MICSATMLSTESCEPVLNREMYPRKEGGQKVWVIDFKVGMDFTGSFPLQMGKDKEHLRASVHVGRFMDEKLQAACVGGKTYPQGH